jgi:hypothetical protein
MPQVLIQCRILSGISGTNCATLSLNIQRLYIIYINLSACHASCINPFFLTSCSPWLPQVGDLCSRVTIYCQCVTKLPTFVVLLLLNKITFTLSVSSEENVNAVERTEYSCQRLTLWLRTMPMPMAIFIQSVYIENATSKSWIMKLVSSNYFNLEFWSVFDF